MHVCQLTAADVDVYRTLMLQAYDESPEAFTSTAQERADEPMSWWRQRVADPRGLTVTFGAFDDAGLCGTVALELSRKPKTRHKAQLIAMAVRPRARGQGIGRALLAAAIDHARPPERRH